jgi:uncharacterized protein
VAAKFELSKDKAGEYRWRLRHQNGNIIADSGEGYVTKANALNGIESVKKNVTGANIKEMASPPQAAKQEPVTQPPPVRQAPPPPLPEIKQVPVSSQPVAQPKSTAEKPKVAENTPAIKSLIVGGVPVMIVAISAVVWFIISIAIILAVIGLK